LLKKFKETIEVILEGFMNDIGVSAQDFYSVIKAGISVPEHKKIFE